MSDVTIQFTGNIAFTTHTGVTIINTFTSEEATINSASIQDSINLIYDVTWLAEPLAGEFVEWRYNGAGDYLLDGSPVPGQTFQVVNCADQPLTGQVMDVPLASKFTFTGAGSPQIVDDATRTFGGNTNSTKFIASASGTVTASLVLDSPVSIVGYETVNYALYLETQLDMTDLETSDLTMIIYVSDTGGPTGAVSVTTKLRTMMGEGWNLITLGRDDFDGPVPDVISWTRIAIQDNTTGRGWSVNYGGMWCGVKQRPKMSITFDDGYISHLTEGHAYMNPLGLRGSCLINGSNIDLNANFMTTADLHTLDGAGWDLLNHGFTHDGMVVSPDYNADVQAGQAFLDAEGFIRARRVFGVAGGQYTDAGTTDLKNNNYTLVRSVHKDVNNLALGPSTRYNYCAFLVQNTITVQDAIDYIDDTIRKGCLGALYIHEINIAGPNSWPIASFQAMIDHLQLRIDQGYIDEILLSEVEAQYY